MPRSRGGRDLERPYGPSARKLPDREYSVVMEDAELLFMNLSGRPGMYNQEGERNFCVILDPEVAEDMRADGWNVKQLKGNQDEEGDFYLQISVKYRDRYGKDLRQLPKIVMRTSKNPRVYVSEENVNLLDQMDFSKADLIINGRTREEDGETKIKAYLKTLIVTIYEDYLDLKYADDIATQDDSILAIEAPSQDPLEGMDIVDAEFTEETS